MSAMNGFDQWLCLFAGFMLFLALVALGGAR